jgi:hypothetical protein
MTNTEYMREWRARNKEKNAEYQKEYNKEYRKKNVEKLNANNKKWREENKEQDALVMLKARLKRKYNLSIDEYKTLIESQNNSCKVCGTHAKNNLKGKLYIDHCHTTGKVRGLLCMKCNSALGLLNDDKALIQNLLDYLS